MATLDPPLLHRKILQIVEHPAVKIVIPVLIALLAVFVLHKLTTHVKWRDVRSDLAAAPASSLLKALGFTALSYVGIAFYDTLAVRTVAPGAVPLRIAAMTSAAGNAISGLLGVSYLTGTAVRYRVYSSFGLDLAQIAGVISVSWTALISGLALVMGGLLAFHPLGLSNVLPISPLVETGIGLAALATLAAYLGWLATGKRHLKAVGFQFPLPRARLGAALTCA